MSRSIRRCLTAAALALAPFAFALSTPPPATADALYPGDSAGTWAFGEVCEDEAWTRSYQLWYILNDTTDYIFDDPDPQLTPGTTVRVDLVPIVSGPGLRGHLRLAGASSVTGIIPADPPRPGDSRWQDVLSDATIGLAWEPDRRFMTVGVDAALPDGWERYAGALGFRATITVGAGEHQDIVMLAQPMTPPCTEAWPTETTAPSAAPTRAPKPAPSVKPSSAAVASAVVAPSAVPSPTASSSPAPSSPAAAPPSAPVASASPAPAPSSAVVPISASADARDASNPWDARPWVVAFLLVLVGGSIGLLAARYLPGRRR